MFCIKIIKYRNYNVFHVNNFGVVVIRNDLDQYIYIYNDYG